MVTIETATARDFCQIVGSQNYEALRGIIIPEIKATKVARISGSSMIEFAPKRRQWVSTLLAAELYPDSKTPKLVVARDESETHEAIRARRSSSEPRLSGEQYKLRNLEQIKFLSLDCVILDTGITELPTKTQLSEVTRWLYDQNIVPVDAEYRIISERMSSRTPPILP